mmetsp:Transcript_24477/g.78975  ORF Transcript_24477/g.78975 Transcript_24477/m.78975 type:complete len:399 (+) Transcript_24477:44-1240(+)
MAKRRGLREATSPPEVDAELEMLLDRVMRIGPNPKLPIIIPYKPDPAWLWMRWRGTVLQSTWRPTVYILLLGVSFVAAIHRDQNTTWRFTAVPSHDHALVVQLKALEAMWGYMLSFATFVISFFTSQAYGFWLATKGNVRKIQGRLNDLGMLLATHAERDENGCYTPRARELLDVVARQVRLFHMLYWSVQVKPAKGDYYTSSLSLLLSDAAVAGLLRRGALTQSEADCLANPELPATQRHSAVIEWIMVRIISARREGVVLGDAGFEQVFLDKACLLRAVCATLPDDRDARMPLAYVHFVQILVDTLLVLAPFALYPRLGDLAVLLATMLTLFYRGFVDLSKSFLDPFGNDGSLGENFQVDTLLGETNAGSLRWAAAGAKLPFSEFEGLVTSRGRKK